MKAVVLAAGYATRLYPLTEKVAKSLLPVGGRPMLDWILDRIVEVGEVDAAHVVTNRKFADSFFTWAEAHERDLRIDVHDDGTTSEEDRLGAIGDIRFVVEQAGLEDDDLFVVAGDNLFDFSLAEFVRFWRGKGAASAVAVCDVADLELAAKLGVISMDGDDRIVEFVEKPERPTSTLAATAAYIYRCADVALIDTYLAEQNSPDQPGRYLGWLSARQPVYGYRFEGTWFDIGDREQLLEADNTLRAREGLPQRADYSAD
ncbi:MAG: NDP-sugar synthase [Gaiellaceae bacterium]